MNLTSIPALLLLAPLAAAQQPAIQIDWIQNPASGRFVGLERGLRSWTDAEGVAVALGGHLATIRNQQEQDFLEQTLIPRLRNDRGMWIGANDIAVEGVWTWVSGEPWGGYTNWLGNQPDNFGGVEDYGHMWGPVNPFGNPSGVWNDYTLLAGSGDPGAGGAVEAVQPLPVGWSWPAELLSGEVAAMITFDRDGDGDLDLAASLPASGGVAILDNDGAGGFTLAVTVGNLGAPAGLASIDADGDGDADLFVADPAGQNLWRLENADGVGGSFGPQVELSGGDYIDVAALDAVGGGLGVGLAVVARTSPLNFLVLRRAVTGSLVNTYASAIPAGARAVVTGDADVDVVDDAFITGDAVGAGTLTLARIAGAQTAVQSISTGANTPGQASLGDVDGDGDLDALVSFTLNDTYRLWRNDGFGTLSAGLLSAAQQSGQGAYGTALVDGDGDGDLDFLVACAGDRELRLHTNTGIGTAAGYETFDCEAAPRLLLVADLDGAFSAPDFLTASTAAGGSAARLTRRTSGRYDDCNGNGIPDADEVLAGTATDCNGNGELDFCDLLVTGVSSDCDINNIPDECDVLNPQKDCDANGVPDNCEPFIDCNNNNLRDACELLAGTAADCNADGVIDSCQLSPSTDCNGDGVIDACQLDPSTDCDANGVLDTCELASGTANDCDANGQIDPCEIAADPALDQNGDGILDACQCGPVISYCFTTPNSAGPGARMGSTGLPSTSVPGFALQATQAPPNKVGLFYYGANSTNVVFGIGVRCVATPLFRLPPGQIDGSGAFSYPLDFTAAPIGSGPGSITAGSTWHFQFWYRDPQGSPVGFNTSDGLRVTFCP